MKTFSSQIYKMNPYIYKHKQNIPTPTSNNFFQRDSPVNIILVKIAYKVSIDFCYQHQIEENMLKRN